MDGLAAGLVTISSLAIFIIAYTTQQFWLGYLSMALVGATAGFLAFNLRKAHVFMGDAGSTFLGYTLASLAVMCEWSYFLPVTLAVPILILGVPILDMVLITVLRVKEDKVNNFKEWIDYTGKDHLSHRLMRLGLGERGAVFSLWGIQGILCLTALAVFPRNSFYGILALILFGLVTLGMTLFFRKKRLLFLRLRGRSPKIQCTKS
jgi:UDP-GlcNAc:undecaprenyl-phosphate GlcNAc-1-phosphate transferase